MMLAELQAKFSQEISRDVLQEIEQSRIRMISMVNAYYNGLISEFTTKQEESDNI